MEVQREWESLIQNESDIGMDKHLAGIMATLKKMPEEVAKKLPMSGIFDPSEFEVEEEEN